MDAKEERRVDGMNWAVEVDTYILLVLHIKQITKENLLHHTGNSTPCSVLT